MSRDRNLSSHLAAEGFAGTKEKPGRSDPCIAVGADSKATASNTHMTMRQCRLSFRDHHYMSSKLKFETI